MIVYFGYVAAEGRSGFAEVRVVREGGRRISQTPTGTVYGSARAAAEGVSAKNEKGQTNG